MKFQFKNLIFAVLSLLIFFGCNNGFMEKLFDTNDPYINIGDVINQGASPSFVPNGPYNGPPGSGTLRDPWIVHDIDTLLRVGRDFEWNLSAHYKQVRNIDLSGIVENWEPIGDESDWFSGSYDGGYCTITALEINSLGDSYQGLFGYINGGTVKALHLKAVNISGSEYTGAIAGFITSGGITNCSVAGNIYAASDLYIGGIAGYVDDSSVEASYFSGTVNAEGSYVGGIAGYVNDSSVKNTFLYGGVIYGGYNVGGIAGYISGIDAIVSDCYSYGNSSVSGNEIVGGIAGAVDYGDVSGCYSYGNVKANNNVGGIAGYVVNGNVTECHSSAGVYGSNDRIGGIAGYISNGTVSLCYSSADVSGNDYIGGIVGNISNGVVSLCYSSADVSGNDYIGGIAGYISEVTVSFCYFSGSVSGNSNVGGIAGIQNVGCHTEGCVALNSNIASTSYYYGRVVGNFISGTLDNNYARDDMTLNGYENSWTVDVGPTVKNGDNVSENEYSDHSWWSTYPGFDFNGVWAWNKRTNLPKLVWEN